MKGRSMGFTSEENCAVDGEVDCIGLLCPLPVLRARKVLAAMQTGAVLRVLASDAMAAIDLPHFCAGAGHVFLGSADVAGGTAYLIRRGESPLVK